MGQLRHSQNDVADRINARLRCLHPFVCGNEASVGFDFALFQANIISLRGAPNGDQHLLGLELLLFAITAGEGHHSSVFSLFNLLDLRSKMAIDAAFLVDAQQFLAYVLILDRHKPWKRLEDCHLRSVGLVD